MRVAESKAKEENSELQKSETIPESAIDSISDEEPDAEKIREAWNCFSVGNQKKGIQLIVN